MGLNEALIGRGLISSANLFAAMERQRQSGGQLTDVLVEMKLISPRQLAGVVKSLTTPKIPPMPRDLADTGVPQPLLMGLMLKLMQY